LGVINAPPSDTTNVTAAITIQDLIIALSYQNPLLLPLLSQAKQYEVIVPSSRG